MPSAPAPCTSRRRRPSSWARAATAARSRSPGCGGDGSRRSEAARSVIGRSWPSPASSTRMTSRRAASPRAGVLLHRSDRAAERLRDVGFGQIGEEPQHEHLALGGATGRRALGGGRRAGRSDRGRLGPALGGGVGRRPRCRRRHGVDREVAGDPHDPGLGVAADPAPAHERIGRGSPGRRLRPRCDGRAAGTPLRRRARRGPRRPPRTRGRWWPSDGRGHRARQQPLDLPRRPRRSPDLPRATPTRTMTPRAPQKVDTWHSRRSHHDRPVTSVHARRRGRQGRPVADDLSRAAVAERLSAGRRWPPGCGRARSTRSSARSSCSARAGRCGSLIEADRLSSVVLWGPPGTGKTTIARLIAGATEQGVRAAVGGHRRREGRARGRRAGPRTGSASRARARSCSSTRCTASTGPSRTRCSRTSRRAARPDRRDHREPVLLAHRPAALALDAVPARAARARRPARAARSARSPTTTAWPRRRAPRRSTTTRSSTSSTAPRATPATRSRRSRSPPRSRPRRARRRSRSPTPRPRSRCARCATATTSTTTCSRRSSRASAAPTSTPGSTGWPACSRRGRTPRLIARRLVILASEDVGMADPQGLVVADAAAARGRVRRAARGAAQPRARGVYLATAPKSNSVDDRARRRDAGRARPAGRRGPARICGTPITLARRSSGTARGTCTRTTRPTAGCDQQYRPDDHAERYWRPTGRGGRRRPASRGRPGASREQVEEADERE